MAGLTFDIQVDINMEPILQAGSTAEHILAVQIAKDTEPFVPAMTKSLVNRTQVVGGTVIYPGPYARYLYYGRLMVDPDTGSAWAKKGKKKVLKDKALTFNKTVHSMAQSHWFEASKAMNNKKWMRVARRAIKRELG